MSTKDKVKELVELMPEPFSIDDLVERVLLLKKIETGQKEIENGEGIDWEDIKKEMDSWLR
jgi:predicted transcriptional regulator